MSLFSGTGKRFMAIAGALALFAGILPAQEKTISLDLGGGVVMEFVLIPAGSFKMGSETGAVDEKPLHQVAITRAFYIGKYEVTQEQWQALLASNPSKFRGPKHPVERVSWAECRAFLESLKAKTQGLRPVLPTEAQWEYACRAGSAKDYYFGDKPGDLAGYGWFDRNSKETTHPAGLKKPNAWGLYDMLGNVYEWCSDRYAEDFYSNSPGEDPRGPDVGERRVARGGSWRFYAVNCRSAIRFRNEPDFRFDNLGFRVVLEIE